MTNRILAPPIFAVVMFAVYYVAIGTVGDWVTGWTNDVLFGEIVPPAVSGWLEGIGTAPWLQGLIVDGIIAGVGAVLGFVPQMLVLFLMLSILEDVGYMARVAFIMDRIFRKFGLSGKSFIPMLIGSGCGVPGVMASRTIENERDRRMTVMTTCFVPCGAKMPIIGLFAGALFGGSGLVAVSAYFIGVAAIIFSGIILKRPRRLQATPAPSLWSCPPTTCPLWATSCGPLGSAAGPSSSGPAPSSWPPPSSSGSSRASALPRRASAWWRTTTPPLLAAIGGAVCFIFRPLGFGTWQATVATVTGLIAKENVVSTFGVLFGLGADPDGGGPRPAGRRGHPLHRPERLQLYDLQPAVRPLLCGYGRHQAGNEQRQVDPGRHRLYVRLCLCGLPHRLPARRAYHRRGLLRHRHHRRRRRPRWLGLPPCPQKQSTTRTPFPFPPSPPRPSKERL